MQPKTELFLFQLLWTAGQLSRPGFRNLTDSFEGWAYRNGFLRQIATLERALYLERRSKSTDDRLYRLTAKGRLHALGGRDPVERWSRSWDGQWRMILFDVPTSRNSERERLRRYLRRRNFGCLQNSVWITPDSVEAERGVLHGGNINVESLVLIEARPCAGESDGQLVNGAWDFERINHRYSRYLEILKMHPSGPLKEREVAKKLLRWSALERNAWLSAVSSDPLLPVRLLPRGYLGQEAWRKRVKALSDAGRQLRSFEP